MPKPSTGIVRDPIFLNHVTENGHPENARRLEAVYRMLDQTGMKDRFGFIAARSATAAEILRVHSAAYLTKVAATASRDCTALTPDTMASAGSYEAARRAVGGLIEAVNEVAAGRLTNAFALVRPPGHHAEKNRALGYCLFNNVAAAAAHARAVLGMERVLIFDWDVHHGNGTQHIFEQDEAVLFFSIHQYPHFPGTGCFTERGIGRGEGFTVNVPIPKGYGDREYAAILQMLLPALALDFRPDLILVSAGFDPHSDDPLGGMQLTPAGFATMTRCLMETAEAFCGGRLALVLEGGYNTQTIGSCVEAVLDELTGAKISDTSKTAAGANPKKVLYALRRCINVQRRYWKSLAQPIAIACAGNTYRI